MSASGSDQRISLPVSIYIGLTLMITVEVFLLLDASARGWAIVPYDDVPEPHGPLVALSRWIAGKVTPICWTGVLFFVEGCLALGIRATGPANGSPVRHRPMRFAFCYLASVPIWLAFDWVNFSFMGAWDYHGLPENLVENYTGYFLAFGAISPAMFLIAHGVQRLGLRRWAIRPWRIGARTQAALIAIGICCLAFPILVRDPVGTLTLWIAWIFLLDPINFRCGAPSVIGDLRDGRVGRPVALAISGVACGLLWEFWNYWAVTKWTYHLPFLGALETHRYFEMPVVGLLGFAPFAIECWVMFQTLVLIGRWAGLRSIEPLPDRDSIL